MLNLSGEPYKIDSLYYLAPPDNLASILSRGLLSHNRAHREGYLTTDISLLGVNDRRGRKEAYGRVLHDYVPLYFNPKNPMLYRRQGEYDIAIIILDRGLLFQNGTVFTDGNAASGATFFSMILKKSTNWTGNASAPIGTVVYRMAAEGDAPKCWCRTQFIPGLLNRSRFGLKKPCSP